jgi:acetolactate synthase-1/2/3 large subunit
MSTSLRRPESVMAAEQREHSLPAAFVERPRTVAHVIAEFLHRQGVRRIWGLTGGHIKPIWDESARAGIAIVDVRHEAAAVHMAQAEADLTGCLAVATVTCGPGLANAVTGIAAAYLHRAPLLVLSALPPSPQLGRGAFEHIPQVEIVAPITRRAVTVRDARTILPELVAATSAALGDDGSPGPVFIDVPIDVLRSVVPDTVLDPSLLRPHRRRPMAPLASDLEAAAQLMRASRRPLVISGRGALAAVGELSDLLGCSQALHLETKENRGLFGPDHPSSVTALRGRSTAECDLVVTVGRALDYELAYGSRAMFAGNPQFLRIGRSHEELADNRRGDVELRGDPALALAALSQYPLVGPERDHEWARALRQEHEARVERLAGRMAAMPPGDDGLMHPYRLIAALNAQLPDDAIVTVDGGDIFSFARIGLRGVRCLDAGAFGCLGVAVPFAVAAALVEPGRRVVSVSGDGSFGFNALEVSTAVRHRAPVVFVVANNAAWNLERTDQFVNYGGNVFGTDLPGCRYDLLGAALGAHGEHVTDPDELPEALGRAIANAPSVVDVAVTRDALSPDFEAGLADLPALQTLRTWDEAERRLT